MTTRKKGKTAGESRKKEHEFHSFDEYIGKFYPNNADQDITQFDEPRSIGTEIAREALKKLKNK